MIRYAFKRILWVIPVLIAVSFVVYGLMELAPGNFVDAIQSEDMTPEMRAELISKYNLDKPMIYRYGLYMFRLLQGDMGTSDVKGTSVWRDFSRRLPNTLVLALASFVIGSVFSIPLGITAAKHSGTLLDSAVTTVSIIGMSMPQFWLGLLLVLLFSLRLNWLPSGTAEHGIRSIILPALSTSFIMIATTARQTRANMLEVLQADYLRTARAKGVPESAVINKHALKNAWIPIITVMGTSLGNQLAGSVVIESVFDWPGVGRMAADAVRTRDMTTATGVIIMISIMFSIVQLIVDLLYAAVDPRVKSGFTGSARKKKLSNIGNREGQQHNDGAPLDSGSESFNKDDLPAILETVTVAASGVQPGPHAQTVIRAPAEAQNNIVTVAEDVTEGMRKSFVTRTTFAETQKDAVANAANEKSSLVTKQYRKRSQMRELLHRLRKHKGAMAALIIFGLLIVSLIYSLSISLESITVMDVPNRFVRPNLQFPFGTDNFGRNMFLRVMYGARYTLAIGFATAAFASLFGITFGCLAGFFGGKTEYIIMRASDVLSSIPGLLMGMVIVSVLGQSLQNLILAVGINAIPAYIRITRASVLTVRNNEFVEAARAIGLPKIRIIFTQVLPNGLSPIIVAITSNLGLVIIVAASLSYLGFGVPVPAPEWGAMISWGKEYIRNAPYVMTIPGLFIMLTVLAFNLLGDGLRDALDPKLKR